MHPPIYIEIEPRVNNIHSVSTEKIHTKYLDCDAQDSKIIRSLRRSRMRSLA